MKEVSHNGGGDNVRFGDIFTEDQFPSETFDYFLSNPPFGVDWKKQQKEIQREHEKRGFDGRFGAGLPRVNDGALLFLQHMWSKRDDMKPKEHKEGSRLAIVFSGSPMFTGGAGSGESEIRRWLLESDWLEAIVALPESMFYNTMQARVLLLEQPHHLLGEFQVIESLQLEHVPFRSDLIHDGKLLGRHPRFAQWHSPYQLAPFQEEPPAPSASARPSAHPALSTASRTAHAPTSSRTRTAPSRRSTAPWRASAADS